MIVYLVIGIEELELFEDVIYFLMVIFMLFGYGDVVIKGCWRLLLVIEVMVGIMIFGWSIVIFFVVV